MIYLIVVEVEEGRVRRRGEQAQAQVGDNLASAITRKVGRCAGGVQRNVKRMLLRQVVRIMWRVAPVQRVFGGEGGHRCFAGGPPPPLRE